MPNTKIKNLTPKTTIVASDEIIINDVAGGNADKKEGMDDIRTFMLPTNAETKTAYEANSDTNEFSDAEQTVVGNTSNTNTGDEPDSSATVKGIVELATITEVNTGTDATRAVSPDGLEDCTGSAQITTVGTLSSGVWSSAITGANVTDALTLDENASIALDPVGSADGKYTGITFTATGGATIAFGRLVYLLAGDSEWYEADADAVATSGIVALAMTVTTTTDGNAVTLLQSGIIRADASFPTLTIGALVYASTTPGDIQVAAPSGADDVVRIIGYAITADEIILSISPDHITTTG